MAWQNMNIFIIAIPHSAQILQPYIMPNPFPKSSVKSWYAEFTKFRISRERYWQPKIYTELKALITTATSQPNVDAAIANLPYVFMPNLNVVLLNIYKDAGRVMGAKAYQLVMKQVKKLQVKRLLPIGVNEELLNDIIAYFQLHDLRMVKEITDTMKDWILKKLIEGQREAKSISQIADEMLKDSFPKNRAIVIARTETIKAANYGAMAGAKKSGYKMNKIWISAQDNRTRRTPRDLFNHLAMDGIVMPIDEPFQIPNKQGSFDLLMQPGDPAGEAGDVVNCRCSVGFIVDADTDGLPIKL